MRGGDVYRGDIGGWAAKKWDAAGNGGRWGRMEGGQILQLLPN